ncbi:MerR family transcriptional regulator [Agriterribacter humi]|jgi:DNA-binding transcriptional MerR regulator|uniref:MerR family transcriptional regulator n=1 Tax=Agriterribacter humi TaxID=1104781 RepID=UPI001D02080A|nr:MerR family transcriptional regulator [Agriterribacter humi]
MFKQLDLFGSKVEEEQKIKPSSPANADKQDLPVVAKTEVAADMDEEIQPPAEENGAAKNKKATAQPTKKGKRGRKSIKEMDAESAMISIPDDELLFKKQYYSIGEVAEMFSLNTSLLRYWETEFDILKPRKNRKGDRHFRPEDIKNLSLIHHLLRQRKYTIEGAKDYLKKNKSKAQQNFELIQRLEKLRRFLLELKAGL